MFLDHFVQAVALAAQDEYSRPRIIDFSVKLAGAFIQAIDPEPAPFQLFERLVDIANANHGKMFERAGGRLGDGFVQSGRAPLGDQNCGSARGMRRAHNRAQIVRIFHAVEQDQQFRGV